MIVEASEYGYVPVRADKAGTVYSILAGASKNELAAACLEQTERMLNNQKEANVWVSGATGSALRQILINQFAILKILTHDPSKEEK